MRIIPTFVHGIADYVLGLVLLVLPNLFGFADMGGGAGLDRVEVLVPPSGRAEILAHASRLREDFRRNNELRSLYDRALQSYGARILDNVDLDRLPDFRSRAAVVARPCEAGKRQTPHTARTAGADERDRRTASAQGQRAQLLSGDGTTVRLEDEVAAVES